MTAKEAKKLATDINNGIHKKSYDDAIQCIKLSASNGDLSVRYYKELTPVSYKRLVDNGYKIVSYTAQSQRDDSYYTISWDI